MALGCRSAEPREPARPLAFHAAFAPIQVDADSWMARPIEASVQTGADSEEARPSGLELNLDEDHLLALLRERLDGSTFAQVSCLERDGNLIGASSNEKEAREASWQRRASEIDANLLVRTTLQFEPEIKTRINDRFWMNLPLFLLGGPFCYFIEDRTYEGRATLVLEFYDLTEQSLDRSLDLSERANGVPIVAEFETLALDFVDRAGGNVGLYALSLIVPAGLLATETAEVDARIDDGVANALLDDLVAELDEQRESFYANARAYFQLDEGRSRVWRTASGGVDVSLAFFVRRNQGIQGWNLDWGTGSTSGSFAGARREAAPGGELVWLERSGLAIDADVSHLRASAVESSSRRRSFTFRIEEPVVVSDAR